MERIRQVYFQSLCYVVAPWIETWFIYVISKPQHGILSLKTPTNLYYFHTDFKVESQTGCISCPSDVSLVNSRWRV